MATDKSVATSVDVLSLIERSLVVDALILKRASTLRASRASTNAAVRIALDSEIADVDALIAKFR